MTVLARTLRQVIPESTLNGEANGNEPFLFVLVADPQLGAMGGAHSWDEDIRIFNAGIDAINALRPTPRFCAILGDLVHHLPECEPTVPNCAAVFKQQISDFKKCISRIREDIPVVLLPGNHDVGNVPSLANIYAFRKTFGPDFFAFDASSHLRVVALNSALLYDPRKAEQLAEEQLAWLDEPGVLDGDGVKIVLQHHPLYVHEEDEEDAISTRSHYEGVPFTNQYFHIPQPRRRHMLAKLRKAGGVHTVFAGHFHQCREHTRGKSGIAMITTSALGAQLGEVTSDGTCLPPRQGPGFRIVKFLPPAAGHPAEIVSKYFNVEDVPRHNISLQWDRLEDW